MHPNKSRTRIEYRKSVRQLISALNVHTIKRDTHNKRRHFVRISVCIDISLFMVACRVRCAHKVGTVAADINFFPLSLSRTCNPARCRNAQTCFGSTTSMSTKFQPIPVSTVHTGEVSQSLLLLLLRYECVRLETNGSGCTE